jgi:pimeloyl-ACP methyl ester carboxylesterase
LFKYINNATILNHLPTVYFISGLGADERAFQFLDLSFCNPVFIQWIEPLKGEDISAYAVRMRQQIKDEEPVIVGLSFGGIVATEIAKQFPVKKIILLSSAKLQKEIPFYMRWLRYFPIHRLTPVDFIRRANHNVYRIMGIEKRSDKLLFEEMFYKSSGSFILWAINQIINWRNNEVSKNMVHIHGKADILLPHRYVHADYTVDKGEHLMVMTKGEIISELLQQVITE